MWLTYHSKDLCQYSLIYSIVSDDINSTYSKVLLVNFAFLVVNAAEWYSEGLSIFQFGFCPIFHDI